MIVKISLLRRAAIAAILVLTPLHTALACSTQAVRGLFEYDAQTQTILNIEAAMARAQAEHGFIPQSAADKITLQAKVALVTEQDFDAQYAIVEHRMVALLDVWRRSLSPQASQYVHFGATTVDIYDTATIMQIEASLNQIELCLEAAISEMSALAQDHQATVMIGRTLGQHAQPITFGKKVSSWIGEYARHRERLGQLRARLRKSAILKGAVGNYSGLGPHAIAIEQSFARELGFDTPYASDWHGTRDVIAEYGLVLGLIAKSHARIGQEIFLLQSTDIGELREALPKDVVGSSSMPHKRNPVAPEGLINAGRSIPRLGEILADDVINFYERDNTSRLNPVIEQISIESVIAARSLSRMIGQLEIDKDAMRRNVDRTAGYAMSQRIAFALADHMPRVDAEELVKQIILQSAVDGIGFAQALNDNAEVSAHISDDEIARLLDPEDIEEPALVQITATLEEVRESSNKQE